MNIISPIKLLVLPVLLLFAGSMHGQRSTNASGGEASGSGGISSYSVGQAVFRSYTSQSAGSVTEGVQQVYPESSECPDIQITATESSGCAGSVLPQLTVNQSDGDWSAISSIGTQVDEDGNVTLGTHQSATSVQDTIVYTIGECSGRLTITILPTPQITASQTTGCSGTELTQMMANIPGGEWSVITSIGTVVDQNGNVMLGDEQTTVNDADTVVYTVNGCSDQVIVTSTLSEEGCQCEILELILSGTPSASSTYVAGTIESTQELQADDNVIYKAGVLVSLKPGFSAPQGSDFRAYIDACEEDAQEDEDPQTELLVEDGAPEIEWHADTTSFASVKEHMVSRVWPNPFRGQFVLEVNIPEPATLSVYLQHIQGGLLRTLISAEPLSEGTYQYRIDRSDLPAGVYLLSVKAGAVLHTHRIIRIQ